MTRCKPPINGSRALAPPCCPSCGRPMLADDGPDLTPIQQRIMAVIERHGEVHSEIIWDVIYGSDPNGGPDLHLIDVHIFQMNRRLKERGLAVQRKRRGRAGQPWRLVRIAESIPVQEAAE